MLSIKPETALLDGVVVLREVLDPCGFTFRQGLSGSSSGGAFASGMFERGDRQLELHFRHGLGLVIYRIGEAELNHETFLRYSGHWPAHQYPDFGSTALESFVALAHDLSAFFSDFLQGSGEQFKAFAAQHKSNPDMFKGFGALNKN